MRAGKAAVRKAVETTITGVAISTRELTPAEGLAQLAILTCRQSGFTDLEILAQFTAMDEKADAAYARNLTKMQLDVTPADVKAAIRRMLTN